MFKDKPQRKLNKIRIRRFGRHFYYRHELNGCNCTVEDGNRGYVMDLRSRRYARLRSITVVNNKLHAHCCKVKDTIREVMALELYSSCCNL